MTTRIVQYKLLAEPHYADLEKAVQSHIENGWQPFHGVAVSIASVSDEPVAMYLQPVVKEEESR